MMSSAPEAPPQSPRRTAIFEQPLNERMRNFLRLEFLFRQALHHNDTPGPWSSRAAVSSILDILAITSRTDTRSDVLKELERQMTLLRDFQSRPGVDVSRLQQVLTRLTQRRDALHASSSSDLARLRENEFLAAIKHRSTIPGGTCEFDLPDYTHWLNLAADARRVDIGQWLETLRPLCDSVADLLWVTRENSRPRAEVAISGSHHIAFDRETPIQLLRITLPGESPLFPQISGSHHRCSIRFLNWVNADTRPVPVVDDVRFILTCCV
jgi:cell division protein ZapD